MEILQTVVDLFLNLDEHLAAAIGQYGSWIYAILFAVIFMETGLVVTPFLPGDSLLFAAGALAAVSDDVLDVRLLLVVLISAAILGDMVNYSIGRRWGRGLLDSGRYDRVIKPQYIEETEAFFEKHGGKTITIARFFPFLRTFAPFIAGVSHMDRSRFTMFNVAGGIAWVMLFVLAGYFFGNIPFVEDNLEVLILGIIGFSVLPAVYHSVVNRRKPAAGE
jgi:membrane-associated protein